MTDNFNSIIQKAVYAIAILLLTFGIVRVLNLVWIGDDAFISFRYAENLITGHGLVYNVGEYVEGYTNFLWTILIAVGMIAGFDPINVTYFLGITSYLAIIIVFYFISMKSNEGNENINSLFIPITSLILLVHYDFAVYATSGLETIFLTALISSGFYTLTTQNTARSTLLAGLIMTLGALTRPDGMIFTIMVIPYLLIARNNRWRSILLYLLPLVLIYLPYWIIRYNYYGYPFPNTYYAKSGDLTYYSQGWIYIKLFFKTYYMFVLTVPALIISIYLILRKWLNSQPGENRSYGMTLLAILFVVPYLFYVIRVGGDFMFARFMIPIIPFICLIIEMNIKWLFNNRIIQLAVALVFIAGVYFSWYQFDPKTVLIDGIADEREHYSADLITRSKHDGEVLQKYLGDKKVVIGFYGSRAMLMYYAEFPMAIECESGLTDEYIAHLPLEERGRIGHEKKPPIDYLYLRRINFTFKAKQVVNDLVEKLQAISFDGVEANMIIYDVPLMEQLKKHPEIKFIDFPKFLDDNIEWFKEQTLEAKTKILYFCKGFYFDHNFDPERYNQYVEIINSGN